MTATKDMTLDELRARIMENAHDRWYITSESDELGLNVETCVANPGWENYWLVIWVKPTKAKVTAIMDNRAEDEWEMGVDDLLQYLHTLPRPMQSFGRLQRGY